MKLEDLLTTAQVAAELGISVRRVQQLVKSGKLRKAADIGGCFFFTLKDVDKVRNRRPGRPKP